MTPFEEFRLWLRQGAAFERAFAAVAVVIAVGLVGWVLVPSNDSTGGGGQVAAGAGSQSAQGATAGPGGQASASGPGATVAGPAGATTPGAAGGNAGATAQASGQVAGSTGGACDNPTTDQGVTATTVTIAVILLDVAGANSFLGVPPPDEQQRENQAVVDALNRQGGLRCRRIVPKYYTDNPLDASSEHAICLNVVAAKVFAAIGGLYQPQNATCLPQNKIPSYTQTIRPTSEMKRFSPYLFSFYDDSDTDFRTYAAGAKEQGFFNGMNKLGVVTYDCFPEYAPQLLGALGRAGIPSVKIETFDYGCPPGGIVVPPSTVAQAVLQFQRHGVDRVMSGGPNLAAFSSRAQSQGYHPKYAVSAVDTTLELTPSSGFAPDPQNFDGALAISNTQYGATNTPGVALSPETNNCNDMLIKGHTNWKAQDGDGYAGGVCNQWNMLVLGSTHAAGLTRASLAAGLNKVGYFFQSFPGAPAMWNDPAKTAAGPYWRPVRYQGSCNCWKVTRAAFSDLSI